MNTIAKRSKKALNLKQYNKKNWPELVGGALLNTPKERQYILRMLIKTPFGEVKLPEELQWVAPIIEMAFDRQKDMGINQPYCYLTIRSGEVTTRTDDTWHVDGFSQTITHLPEQNYIWTSDVPTEFVVKKIKFPKDFDSFKHNIHLFFEDKISSKDKVQKLVENILYCMDPYVIHRRPAEAKGVERTFVRISFTPIEINDVNNTLNPLIPTNYTRDAVKEFRNNLIPYTK